MTQGALIFAFNNESTDYVALAQWSARNIRRHLKIPIALVTNLPTGDSRLRGFDKVITCDASQGGTRWFEDYQANVSWYNAGRTDAFDLSPWDQTLVLDADYVVASNNLKLILDTPKDFLCFRKSYDVTRPTDTFLNSFGRGEFPMWWATAMMFRKTQPAEFIFESMKMIKANWKHYVDLYGIESSTYRNDYALSIALGILSGHTLNVDSIPWPMPAALPEHTVEYADIDSYYISYRNSENKEKYISISGLDFHAMGKKHLEDVIASTA